MIKMKNKIENFKKKLSMMDVEEEDVTTQYIILLLQL